MKEHYCSYSQAVKLKEFGFDEPCEFYYNPYQELRISKDCLLSPKITNNRFLEEIADGMATAPRLDQAQAWLREEKEIDINISAYQHLDGESVKHQYNFGVLTINGETFANTWYDNYEQALFYAIDTALELLGKEV